MMMILVYLLGSRVMDADYYRWMNREKGWRDGHIKEGSAWTNDEWVIMITTNPVLGTWGPKEGKAIKSSAK